ncbi:MAG: hypothetical protein Q8K93_24720, partial [Reyranella sp.]|nr:hypothetical protein [Reyranella sp.]
MRPSHLALAALSLILTACGPSAPKGVDAERLRSEVSKAIGDPYTCVLLVEKGSGDVIWRFGDYSTCARSLPSCQGAARLNADGLGKLAAAGEERTLSCASTADGGSRVGWASGTAPMSEGAKHRDLAYAAVMEGPTVL